MSEDSTPVQPGPGDYVVLYQSLAPSVGNPRLALVRVSDCATHVLVRATFSPAEEAGPRFEDEARERAAAAGTRGFRCVDAQYTPLDEATDDHDA